jgi:hypothetical protein
MCCGYAENTSSGLMMVICRLQVINKAGSIPVTGAIASIVEWLAHISDKDEIKVQFLVEVQKMVPKMRACISAK